MLTYPNAARKRKIRGNREQGWGKKREKGKK
jgi:hypothetical protein